MPAKAALNVSLTLPLREFVEEQVASGRFGTASEGVRSALRLLEDSLRNQGRALEAPKMRATNADAHPEPPAANTHRSRR